MRALAFFEHGGLDVLTLADVGTPQPGPGEVRVAVRAVALNHLDLWVLGGLPNIKLPLPHVGGSDIAGVVDAVGGGVQGCSIGDEVVLNPSLPCHDCEACRRGETSLCMRYRILGEHVWGGLADYVVVPADRLHPKPTHLSWEEAASMPLSFQTAWRALVTRARLQPGEDLLVLGASGGVATAALQIGRLMGARVLAVTSSPERCERALQLGAHLAFDRTASSWSKAVWQATNKRGADVILDSVGAAVWPDCLRTLVRGGRLVTYGATSGPLAETDLRYLFFKQLSLLGSTMASDAEFDDLYRLIARGALLPVVAQTFSLADGHNAYAALQAGGVMGKVVVRVDGAPV